jgi:hypothetical protein
MSAAWAKTFGYFERFQAIAALYPVLCTVLVLTVLPVTVLCLVSIARGRNVAALWWAVAVIVILVAFSWGDDTFTHTFRVVAIAEQIRAGDFSLFLTNSQTGVALPTFVYYSVVPYVLPVMLNLIGIPALAAFKLGLALQLAVMGLGIQRIVEKTQPSRAGFLAAILFMTANYSYEVWVSRAAFAELWVYAMMPWVVSNSLDPRPSRRSALSLTLVLFLQACAHPIVLVHSLLCEVPVVLGLSRLNPIELARRWIVPFIAALVLAMPFWLPPALWQPYIQGPGALPADFSDSFQSLAKLVDPKNNRNIGPWLPLAVFLTIAIARPRLSLRTWFLIAAWALLFGLQSTYLRPIALRIPTLELSLFVWRLMLPAALIAFAAVVSGWIDIATRAGGTAVRARSLAWLASLSVVFMAGFTILQAPDYISPLAQVQPDHAARVAFDTNKDDAIWGIREYLPNYAELQQACFTATPNDVQTALFADLRTGVAATRPYLAVHFGPTGLVQYRVDGRAIRPAACGNMLMLGPFTPGAKVTASHAGLDWLLVIRGIVIAGLAVAMAWMFVNRKQQQPNGSSPPR